MSEISVRLFKPYKAQKDFIEEFTTNDGLFGVAVAPRGSGKTLLAMNLMLYWLLSQSKQRGAWFSPVYKQATSVFDQVLTAAKDLVVHSNRSELAITFVNNSTLKFLSADSPDSIRGYRFEYVVIDEAAFIKDLTIDQAIIPTLNPNGRKCLLISTPKGKNHLFRWFHREDVVSHRFKLEDCPYISRELIESAKTSLPKDIFAQEYEAAFVDSGNDVFVGVDEVSIVHKWEATSRVDAFCGIDTGLTQDMSVLTIISSVGRVLWIEGVNNLSIQEIATRFSSILSRYNIVGGYIETNGIGRATYDLIAPKHRRIQSFTTTQDSKTEMVRKLISDIETSTIELPSLDLCPQLHTELSTFTYKMSNNGKLSFGHMPGAHDDYVDSLMLANYARNSFMSKKPITINGIRRKSTLMSTPK